MSSRVLPILLHHSVLFPGVTTVVRLGTPKERKIARDVVAGDRTLGIIALPGWQGSVDPPLTPGLAGCVAKVVSAKKIPNRLIRLVLEGTERFAIQSKIETPEPYVVAEVTPLVDLPESAKLLNTFADEVRQLYERYARASGRIAGSARRSEVELPADPAELSLHLPAILSLDEETCQRFLASRSTLMRLRELSALLSPAAESAEESAEVLVRSRGNGHGASRS